MAEDLSQEEIERIAKDIESKHAKEYDVMDHYGNNFLDILLKLVKDVFSKISGNTTADIVDTAKSVAQGIQQPATEGPAEENTACTTLMGSVKGYSAENTKKIQHQIMHDIMEKSDIKEKFKDTVGSVFGNTKTLKEIHLAPQQGTGYDTAQMPLPLMPLQALKRGL